MVRRASLFASDKSNHPHLRISARFHERAGNNRRTISYCRPLSSSGQCLPSMAKPCILPSSRWRKPAARCSVYHTFKYIGLVVQDGYVAGYGLDQLVKWIAPPARATILSIALCTSPYGDGTNCRTANDVEVIRCPGAERIIPR